MMAAQTLGSGMMCIQYDVDPDTMALVTNQDSRRTKMPAVFLRLTYAARSSSFIFSFSLSMSSNLLS